MRPIVRAAPKWRRKATAPLLKSCTTCLFTRRKGFTVSGRHPTKPSRYDTSHGRTPVRFNAPSDCDGSNKVHITTVCLIRRSYLHTNRWEYQSVRLRTAASRLTKAKRVGLCSMVRRSVSNTYLYVHRQLSMTREMEGGLEDESEFDLGHLMVSSLHATLFGRNICTLREALSGNGIRMLP